MKHVSCIQPQGQHLPTEHLSVAQNALNTKPQSRKIKYYIFVIREESKKKKTKSRRAILQKSCSEQNA